MKEGEDRERGSERERGGGRERGAEERGVHLLAQFH